MIVWGSAHNYERQGNANWQRIYSPRGTVIAWSNRPKFARSAMKHAGIPVMEH